MPDAQTGRLLALAYDSDNIAFVFSVNTAAYDTISNSTAWTWAKQDRVGNSPAYQYTGPDEDTKTFTGTLYPHVLGNTHAIDDLRLIAAKGKPLLLVNEDGLNLCQWIITTITEEQTAFVAATKPRKQTYTLNLTRYSS